MQKILYLLLLLPISSLGQNHFFEPAWITRNDGQVEQGEINRVRESELSKEIAFRSNPGAEVRTILPGEIRSFGFAKDSLLFEQVTYSYKKAGVSIAIPRFAKLMQQGLTTLYLLQLSVEEQNRVFEQENTFVYIWRLEGKDYTLRQTETLIGGKYTYTKEYQNVLRYLTLDCPAVQAQTGRLGFRPRDIERFLEKYERCKAPETNMTHFSYKVPNKIWQGPEFSLSFLVYNHATVVPGMTIGYYRETLNPDLNEHISIISGFSFQFLSSTTVKEYQNGFYSLNIPLRCNVYLRQGRVMPFLDFGGSFKLSNLDGFSFFYNYGAGVWINKLRIRVLLESERINFQGLKIWSIGIGSRW
jgi:hypothetical protein